MKYLKRVFEKIIYSIIIFIINIVMRVFGYNEKD